MKPLTFFDFDLTPPRLLYARKRKFVLGLNDRGHLSILSRFEFIEQVAQLTSKCVTSVTNWNKFVLSFELDPLKEFLLIIKTECMLLFLQSVGISVEHTRSCIGCHGHFAKTKTYFMLTVRLVRYLPGNKSILKVHSLNSNTLIHKWRTTNPVGLYPGILLRKYKTNPIPHPGLKIGDQS